MTLLSSVTGYRWRIRQAMGEYMRVNTAFVEINIELYKTRWTFRKDGYWKGTDLRFLQNGGRDLVNYSYYTMQM
jgi:hypothetical protein